MAIRYDKELRAQIDDTIRRYNAKIDRIRRRDDIEKWVIPDKRQYSDFIGEFNSRKELKSELARLNRYLNKGAERAVKIGKGYVSAWEYDELERDLRREKSYTTRLINKLGDTEFYEFGEKTNNTYKNTGNAKLLNLQSRRDSLNKDLKTLDKRTFRRQQERVKRYKYQRSDKRISTWHANFQDMILQLGYLSDLDADLLLRVEDKLTQISDVEFEELYKRETALQRILDFYTATVIDYEKRRYGKLNNETENQMIDFFNDLDEALTKIIDGYRDEQKEKAKQRKSKK